MHDFIVNASFTLPPAFATAPTPLVAIMRSFDGNVVVDRTRWTPPVAPRGRKGRLNRKSKIQNQKFL